MLVRLNVPQHWMKKISWSLINCSFYPAEKRAMKKPERFSSGLPESQELLEIRTKKKVSALNWSKSTAKL